jgi:hypothetical protein
MALLAPVARILNEKIDNYSSCRRGFFTLPRHTRGQEAETFAGEVGDHL